MQTVLESLENSYLNILNIESEANREDSNSDTYIREEIYRAKSELIKAIVLLVNSGNVVPNDKRVYLDIVNGQNVFARLVEQIKQPFMEILYKKDILIREKTIADLITELRKYSPHLKVKVLGKNSMNKVVIDDSYTDKIVIVGVES